MLVFIIPLKSKEVAKSWTRTSRLFERTLRSICNQTSQDFKAVVICNERPNIDFEHPHVEYIQVDFTLPVKEKNLIARLDTDKGRKILKGLIYGRKFKSGYAMVVDADDCVSRNLAEFVNRDPQQNGWFVNKGYKYVEGSDIIYLHRRNFYKVCGTGTIIRYDLLDLPETPEYNRGYGYYNFFLEHALIRNRMAKKGTPIKPLPFAGVIYTINKENIHMKEYKPSGIIDYSKEVLKKIINNRPFAYLLRNEFGLYNIT